jgi:hypothetical protein
VAGELQEVLLRVLEILAAEGELRDQLGQLHRELWRVLHASNLYVALYDEPTGLYFFPYNADPDDQDFTPQALRKSLTDYVRRTAEPLLCREAEMDQLVAAGHIERIGLPSPVWLGAPLVTPRGCLGAVVVQHYTDAGALGPGDVDTLAGGREVHGGRGRALVARGAAPGGARDAAARAGAGEGRGGPVEPGQEPVPGEHVPRAAHAAQRHPGVHRPCCSRSTNTAPRRW